ncbi:hypothetical protein [Natronorubrum halophilum]|uniref:hypothetical protein n=1 Tax=Natronorubrum halophilum TaxID=1702106 RepID=UPI0010C18706|nr:hypothetical protein [Natronorubrum halophilum]
MTRRELFRRSAIAGGTMVAAPAAVNRITPRHSPIGRAQAAVPLAPVLIAGYAITHYVLNNYTGDDVSKEYNAIAFENHLNIYNDAIEIHDVSDENLLASLETNANSLQNTAREEAIMQIYETVSTGGTRSEAQTAAEDAIAEVFIEPEKSLATRVSSLVNGIITKAADMDVLALRDSDGSSRSSSQVSSVGVDFYENEKDFVDGTSQSMSYPSISDTSWTGGFNPMSPDSSFDYKILTIDPPDPSNYDGVSADDYDLSHVDGQQDLVDSDEYRSVRSAITSSYNAVLDEVESLLSTHYDGMSAGDLSLSDMLSTGAMLDTVEGATSWQEAALYFRTVGLPEALEPGRISFDPNDLESVSDDDGNTTDGGDLPDEPVKFDGKLGWSLSTEVEGNELPVGSRIDPSNYPGQIYAAIEWEDDNGDMQADVFHLTGPFTIESVNSGSGTLKFEARDVVTADTSAEEARSIFRQNRQSEETAKDQTIEVVVDDGGGGVTIPGVDELFNSGGGSLLGLGIIGVVVLAIIGVVTDLIPGLGGN